MIDVVTVPDFMGRRAGAFEARTLLFLASWMEYAGSAREWPVHLACIGNPPKSVHWLADQCGAHISVHQPVEELGPSANKLRGLEVQARTKSVLLLDTDVLLMGDPGELASLGPCLAAAPANVPRVPEAYWRRIYAGLGLALPDERMACVTAEHSCQPRLGLAYPEQQAEMTSMLPYFNSGVVLAPWDCGLRRRWEEHMRAIRLLFTDRDAVWPQIAASDQTGLATAIESLRSAGIPFRPLPASCNANWLHVYRGTLPVDRITLFHAMFLFGKMRHSTHQLAAQLYRFRLHVAHRLFQEWRHDGAQRWNSARRYLWPSLMAAQTLGGRWQHIYRQHVRAALERG